MDIIDEVAEEVQHEKLLNLWKKYSVFIYIFLSLVIIATAVYAFWKEHVHKEVNRIATLYTQALELEKQDKIEEAAAIFNEIIHAKVGGFSGLAELSLSDMMATRDKEKAREELIHLATSSNSPSSLKNVALIKSLLLEIDEASPEVLKEKLGKLIADGSNPWAPLAIELKAALEYREGNLAKAYALYDTLIKNPNISSGIRIRSLKMMMILKSKGADAL